MKLIIIALITLIFLSGCQGNAPTITELELSGPATPGLNDQAIFSLKEGHESFPLKWRILDSQGENQQQAILEADYLKLKVDIQKLNGKAPYKVEVINEKLSLEDSFMFFPLG